MVAASVVRGCSLGGAWLQPRRCVVAGAWRTGALIGGADATRGASLDHTEGQPPDAHALPAILLVRLAATWCWDGSESVTFGRGWCPCLGRSLGSGRAARPLLPSAERRPEPTYPTGWGGELRRGCGEAAARLRRPREATLNVRQPLTTKFGRKRSAPSGGPPSPSAAAAHQPPSCCRLDLSSLRLSSSSDAAETSSSG